MQTSEEAPEPPPTLVGEMLQNRLVELVISVRVTVLVNPLIGVTVTVDVP